MKLKEILADYRSEFLFEGLIKVPADMMNQLVDRTYTEYLSYMFHNTAHKDDAKELARKYGVAIIQNFKERNVFIEITSLLKGLSPKIINLWKLEFGRLDFMIDWENKYYVNVPKSNATFDEKTGQFMINPAKFKELVTSDAYSKNAVESLLEKVKTTMWHEASHAIQHNALKWADPNQVGKSRKFRDDPNSSKKDRRQEYLTSAVEFDPTIKTKIFVFRDKNKDKTGKELLTQMAIFVGAIQASQESDEFFIALKETNFARWKKAVKLFYQFFDINVDNLLK